MATPAPVRILWRNLWDGGTVTASSAGYGTAATNTQLPQLAQVWGTGTSSAAEWIQADLGSAQSITCFAVLGHTLTTGDANIYLYGSNDGVGYSYVLTPTYRAGTLIEFVATTTAYRYWRFQFTKSAAGQSREIARILLGTYYQPPRPPTGKPKIIPLDPSDTWRSDSGATWSDIKAMYERVEMKFAACSQAQADEWLAMGRACGKHSPILLSGDHANYPTSWLWYGKLAELSGLEYEAANASGKLWNLGLVLETEA